MATPTSATSGTSVKPPAGGTPVQTSHGSTSTTPPAGSKGTQTPTGGTTGQPGQLTGSYESGFQYVVGPPPPAQGHVPDEPKVGNGQLSPYQAQMRQIASLKSQIIRARRAGDTGLVSRLQAEITKISAAKGKQKLAKGGMVKKRMSTEPGGPEEITAHEGEFVVNRQATKKHKPLLTKINKSGVRGRGRMNGPPARAKFVPGKTLF